MLLGTGSPPDSIDAATARHLWAQQGDREAFDELRAIGKESGVSYSSGWSEVILLVRLKDRASSNQ
jgi:hypothetical protein